MLASNLFQRIRLFNESGALYQICSRSIFECIPKILQSSVHSNAAASGAYWTSDFYSRLSVYSRNRLLLGIISGHNLTETFSVGSNIFLMIISCFSTILIVLRFQRTSIQRFGFTLQPHECVSSSHFTAMLALATPFRDVLFFIWYSKMFQSHLYC